MISGRHVAHLDLQVVNSICESNFSYELGETELARWVPEVPDAIFASFYKLCNVQSIHYLQRNHEAHDLYIEAILASCNSRSKPANSVSAS